MVTFTTSFSFRRAKNAVWFGSSLKNRGFYDMQSNQSGKNNKFLQKKQPENINFAAKKFNCYKLCLIKHSQ